MLGRKKHQLKKKLANKLQKKVDKTKSTLLKEISLRKHLVPVKCSWKTGSMMLKVEVMMMKSMVKNKIMDKKHQLQRKDLSLMKMNLKQK